MRHELFIYYRAPASQAEALTDAVRRMQQQLSAQYPGLDARLLRRADAADGDTTWMETYRLPADADPAALIDAIAAAAQSLQLWIAGPRHVEHFLPCAS
jgi:chromosome condensin MukBEF complex kleisin-like MukF subunit